MHRYVEGVPVCTILKYINCLLHRVNPDLCGSAGLDSLLQNQRRCEFTTSSLVSFCCHMFGDIFTIFILPPPLFPLGTTMLSSASEGFLFCSFISYTLFYVPHMTEIIWFLAFSVWLISVSIYFQGPSILWQMAVVHPFLGPSSIPLYICPHLLYPCLGHHK